MKNMNLWRYLWILTVIKMKYGSKVSIGKTLSILAIPKISVKRNGKISIGAHSCIEKGEFASVDGNIQIGEHTYFGTNCSVTSRGEIEIGSYCSFGPNVAIYDHNHCFGTNGIEVGYRLKKVKIGNHVWIGHGCIILAGSIIGDNCVIGAGTVVQGNIPANSLVTASRELFITKLEEKHG